MNSTTTPVIEKLKVHEQTVRLYVDMNLASMPVTITGQYNVDSNCFYPGTIMPVMNVVSGDKVLLETGKSHSLEDACEILGWDYYETHNAIQQAVENR